MVAPVHMDAMLTLHCVVVIVQDAFVLRINPFTPPGLCFALAEVLVGQRVVDREAEIVSRDQGEWNEISSVLDQAVLFPGVSRRRIPIPTDGKGRAMAVCVPKGFHTPVGAPPADPRGV